jgi:hypothetical protein
MLVRIPGLPGYFDADGLKRPCGTCGGTVFWVYRRGLRCVNCVPQNPRRPEKFLGIVDIEHLELGLQKKDGSLPGQGNCNEYSSFKGRTAS